MRPIQAARQTSSRAASISSFMSARAKAIAWFSMIALAELLALLGVVERVLVGGAGDAERLGADRRPARLEGLHRRLRLGLLALADAGEALVELLLAAQQAGARDAAVVEVDVGGVRGAQAVLLDLGALLAALGARAG